MDLGTAEGFLVDLFAGACDHRRARREQLRGAAHHHRVVTGADPGRAHAGNRAEAECDHRHFGERRQRLGENGHLGKVGTTEGFEMPYRSAATGAVDQANQGQAPAHRLGFGEGEFLAQPAVVGAASHGEVVAGDEDLAAIEPGTPANDIGGREPDELAVRVVLGEAGGGADFIEAAGIGKGVEPLANGELAVRMVASDLLRSAHLPGEFLPTGILVDLGLPVHPVSIVVAWWRAYDTSLPGFPPRRRPCPVSPRTSRRCTRIALSWIVSRPRAATALPRSSASFPTWPRPMRSARRSSRRACRWY